MIDEPGSFSGIFSSRETGPRAAGVPAHVVGDLHERAGQCAQRGADVHHRVVGRQGRELVRRRDERLARFLGDFPGRHFAETRIGVQPGTDRRSPDGQFIDARQRARRSPSSAWSSCATQPEITWPRVIGSRVLEVRPAHHHRLGKFADFSSSVSRNVRTAGMSTSSTCSTVAMCITVGKVSLDDWL